MLPIFMQQSLAKPLSQMQRSTFLPLQDADPTPSFGGFGIKLKTGALIIL